MYKSAPLKGRIKERNNLLAIQNKNEQPTNVCHHWRCPLKVKALQFKTKAVPRHAGKTGYPTANKNNDSREPSNFWW